MRIKILSILVMIANLAASAASPIYPKPLQEGDSFAIVSPSSIIKPELVFTAMEALKNQGWQPYASEAVFGRYGTYAGPAEMRLADFEKAWESPGVHAIMCSRGGYGAVHLLDSLSRLSFANPKWVIGFSDISALHSLLASKGIVSVHAKMASGLDRENGTDTLSQDLFKILRGGGVDISVPADSLNRTGHAEGKLVGGNRSVLAGLIGTPYDVIAPGTILFIEDVDEPIYKIERILYQLRLRGVLPRLAGLIVGQFTGIKDPPKEYNEENPDMYTTIYNMVKGYGYPVAFNFPIGHVDDNRPVLCNAPARLDVTDEGVTLRQPGALDKGQR